MTRSGMGRDSATTGFGARSLPGPPLPGPRAAHPRARAPPPLPPPALPRPPRPSVLYLLIGVVSWPVLRIVFRLRWSGRENIPDGGCVLAANHWSNFDPWPLGIPLFPRRFLRFMAKKELFWPPLGWIITAGGGFRVDRGKQDQQAIDTAVELCRAGHAVVMFPEGTRRAKGIRKRYEARWHTGAARIALSAPVPLVPAGIAGTERLGRLGPLGV